MADYIRNLADSRPLSGWRRVENANDDFTWSPILLVTDSGIWLGVDRSGHWAIGRQDGRVDRTVEGQLSPAWLTILDLDPDVLAAELREVEDHAGLPSNCLLPSLPIDQSIDMALRSGSPHWVASAVRWIDGAGVTDRASDLRSIVGDLRFDQRTRQRVRRLLRGSAS